MADQRSTSDIHKTAKTLKARNSLETFKIKTKCETLLTADIFKLYEGGIESDLTLISQGRTFHVHKAILQARHKTFWSAVLSSPHDKDCVTLDLTSNDELQQVLRYIYSDKELSLLDDVLDTLQSSSTTPSTSTSDGPALEGTEDSGESDSGVPEGGVNGTVSPLPDLLSELSINTTSHEQISRKQVDHVVTSGIASSLGADLLALINDASTSDVTISVGDAEFKLHKCILCARSPYFSAMLGGGWAESDSGKITLESVSSEVMDAIFRYMYGGVADMPAEVSVMELALYADMFAVSGMKDLISFIIKRDKCHFFHKPCAECIAGVIAMLPAAYAYNLTDMLCVDKAIKWIARNFVRVWGTKSFHALPEDVLDKSLQGVIQEIDIKNVIDMVIECDKLMGSFTSVKSSENVVALTTSLMDACLDFLRNSMVRVFQTPKFYSLGLTMALGLGILEDVLGRAIMTMQVEKGCETHSALLNLVADAEREDCEWNEDFRTLIDRLHEKSRHFMMLHINRLVDTHGWATHLSTEVQERIKKDAWYVTVGNETFVRAQPPKFTSLERGPRLTSSRPHSSAGRGHTEKSALYKKIAAARSARSQSTNKHVRPTTAKTCASDEMSSAAMMPPAKSSARAAASSQLGGHPEGDVNGNPVLSDDRRHTANARPAGREGAAARSADSNNGGDVARGHPASGGASQHVGVQGAACNGADHTGVAMLGEIPPELYATVEPVPVLPGTMFTASLERRVDWSFTAPEFLFLSAKNNDPHGPIRRAPADTDN